MTHMSQGYESGTPASCCTPSRTSPSRSSRLASRTATPGGSPLTPCASSCSRGSPRTRTSTWSSTATCSTPRSSSRRTRP
jgi:hypothetical protein